MIIRRINGSFRGLFFPGIARKCSSDNRGNGGGKKKRIMEDPIRQVFISQSNDIYSNLALEDWLYRHHDFDYKHLLLLWRNAPCVVIGRHQNPWIEANVPFLRDRNIDLARRNSGGGTVYHDLGNINCTFFTRRDRYARKKNLEIICSAIKRLTSLDVGINEREDIVLNRQHKISGTAAKLGRVAAYHHCTVLVDVNACVLHDSLHSKVDNYESRATQSVRVPVRNIKDADPSVSVDSLIESIGNEFLRTDIYGNDRGCDNSRNKGFQRVRPDNDWFFGLDQLREELKGYEWIFGKTPKFTVTRSFNLPSELYYSVDNSDEALFEIKLEVLKGRVNDVTVVLPGDISDADYDLCSILYGQPFTSDLPGIVEAASDKIQGTKREFLVNCIKDIVADVA